MVRLAGTVCGQAGMLCQGEILWVSWFLSRFFIGSLLALGDFASAQSSGGMPGGTMGGPGRGMMGQLSPEDLSAFVDAHIAALKAGLKLTAEQEKLWPPIEDAMRNHDGRRDDGSGRRSMIGGWFGDDDDDH